MLRGFRRPGSAQNLVQVNQHVVEVLIPLGGSFCYGFGDQPLQLQGDSRPERGKRFRFAIQNGIHKGVFILRPERGMARYHLIDHQAERPDVGSVVSRFAPRLLGRHIHCGSHGGTCLCQLCEAGKLGQSEVNDSGHPVRRDHDVGGLDVAVCDALLVSPGEALRHLGGDVDRVINLERSPVNLLLEAFSLVIFHHNEHPPLRGLVDVMDDADVGVLERGGGLGFVNKPLFGLRIVREFRGEEFEGNEAVELEVPGFVDNAHTASAQVLENLVVRDCCADHSSLKVYHSGLAKDTAGKCQNQHQSHELAVQLRKSHCYSIPG